MYMYIHSILLWLFEGMSPSSSECLFELGSQCYLMRAHVTSPTDCSLRIRSSVLIAVVRAVRTFGKDFPSCREHTHESWRQPNAGIESNPLGANGI